MTGLAEGSGRPWVVTLARIYEGRPAVNASMAACSLDGPRVLALLMFPEDLP